VEVVILTAEDAGQAFQNNTLGDKNIFILFKNVDMANKAYKAGLKYEKIQLGGIPNEAGKKMVFTAVSLSSLSCSTSSFPNETAVN
ncbi:PTS sugar transporter subunit IIB, partial [Clostridioides difficile]|uniref:PTS sugar transporter subunit IIB n=1 Tax=Clostridioides difficile TaxID=1496 RepID=UPI0018DCE0F3